MKQIINKINATLLFLLASLSINAQIEYSNNYLKINASSNVVLPMSNYNLQIKNWNGLYWLSPASKLFQVDLSATNPRIAGNGNKIVFMNSATSTYNTIEVASVLNLSDENAKTDIQSLSYGLNSVMNLRPVSYKWLQPSEEVTDNAEGDSILTPRVEDEGLQYGFLAQELEKVLPDVVKTSEDGHKTVNYIAMIPVLVQAIQELQATVDMQNKKIEELSTGNKGESNTDYGKIIKISPNPTTGNVNIETSLSEEATSALITISSTMGLEEKRISVPLSFPTINLDLSGIQPGIHIVTLWVNGISCDSSRIIKE